MSIKKLSDKTVAKRYHITERNLQQTYKNPKPTITKKVLTDEEIREKKEQYEIIRLGATCKAFDISEELLLDTINFIKSIKK